MYTVAIGSREKSTPFFYDTVHGLQHDPVDNVKLLTDHVFKVRTGYLNVNLISLSDFNTLMFIYYNCIDFTPSNH